MDSSRPSSLQILILSILLTSMEIFTATIRRAGKQSTSDRNQERGGTYKWNWNAPFMLSPHSPTRLYMGANKIFRSDDRGQSWKIISDDITSQTDRNTWPVMDHYWSIDAVAKDVSTSLYGMAVSIA